MKNLISKETFKKVTISAFLCSIFTVASIYIYAYYVADGGISSAEYSLMGISLLLISMVSVIVMNTFSLHELRAKNKSDKKSKGIIQCLLLTSLVSVFTYLFDHIYYFIDNTIPTLYGKVTYSFIHEFKDKLDGYNVQIQEADLLEQMNATFFVQNSALIIVGIFIGSIISFITLSFIKKLSKPVVVNAV